MSKQVGCVAYCNPTDNPVNAEFCIYCGARLEKSSAGVPTTRLFDTAEVTKHGDDQRIFIIIGDAQYTILPMQLPHFLNVSGIVFSGVLGDQPIYTISGERFYK